MEGESSLLLHLPLPLQQLLTFCKFEGHLPNEAIDDSPFGLLRGVEFIDISHQSLRGLLHGRVKLMFLRRTHQLGPFTVSILMLRTLLQLGYFLQQFCIVICLVKRSTFELLDLDPQEKSLLLYHLALQHHFLVLPAECFDEFVVELVLLDGLLFVVIETHGGIL